MFILIYPNEIKISRFLLKHSIFILSDTNIITHLLEPTILTHLPQNKSTSTMK